MNPIQLPKRRRIGVRRKTTADGQTMYLVNRGAIHGLPVSADEAIAVRIFNSQTQAIAGHARIETVGITSSALVLDAGLELADNEAYEAELSYELDQPIRIALEGDDAHFEILDHAFRERYAFQEPMFIIEFGAKNPDYILHLHNDSYRLHWGNGLLLHGYQQAKYQERAEGIIHDLDVMGEWVQLKNSHNPDTKIAENALEMAIVLLHPQTGKEHTFTDSAFELVYKGGYIPYQIMVRNVSDQTLYFSWMQLGFDFSIEMGMKEETELQPHSGWYMLTPPDQGISLAEGFQESIERFKVFFSTQPVGAALKAVEQKGIDIGKIQGSRNLAKADWRSKTISIRLVREDSRLHNRPVRLGDWLTVEGNAQLSAALSLQSAQVDTRSLDHSAEHALLRYQTEALQPYTIGVQNDTPIQSLQLQEMTNAESLAKDPLRLTLEQEALGDNEHIVALAFDGDQLVLLNEPRKNADGKAVIEIGYLPEEQAGEQGILRPRSFGKAIKLFFYKIIGKPVEDIFLLRWVDYHNNAERKATDLAQHVGTARRILILVHGIIGDTAGMASMARFAMAGQGGHAPSREELNDAFGGDSDEEIEPTGTAFAHPYDLVLTFDYENLNTPIEQIAERFKSELHKVGIHAEDDKEVTILAHSMGGLVSRYFIEKLDGHVVVDKLIMAGTPNGGSLFGKVDEYRSLLCTALSASVGFFGWAVGAIGGAITALTGLGQLTKTLGQMNTNSDFITNLNSSFVCPKIPYIILAGDIHHPKWGEIAGGFWGRFLEKATIGVGKMVYGQAANDIAVSVASITCLLHPECEQKSDGHKVRLYSPLACHHLNYFDDEDSVRILKEVL